jgi:hypothetical protein
MLPAADKVIFGMYTSTGTSLNTLQNQWGIPIQLTRVYSGSGPVLNGITSCQNHLNAGRVPVISINWNNELKGALTGNNNVNGTGKSFWRFMGDGQFDGDAGTGMVTITTGGVGSIPGIRKVARQIAALTPGLCPTNRIVVTPFHEMENVGESGWGSGASSVGGFDTAVNTALRDAFQRLPTEFDAEGATNVLWGFCGATGPSHWGGSLTDTGSSQLYPGHNFVDWMMCDPYNKSGQVNCSGGKPSTGFNNPWRDFGPPGSRGDTGTHVLDANNQMSWYFGTNTFSGAGEGAKFKVGGKPTLAQVTGSEGVYKPMILGETGTGELDPNATGDPSKRASVWFDNMSDWCLAHPEVVRGMIYFNNQYNNVECPTYRPIGFPGRGNKPVWATIEEG